MLPIHPLALALLTPPASFPPTSARRRRRSAFETQPLNIYTHAVEVEHDEAADIAVAVVQVGE
jgi:hypothetical protein